MKGVGSEIGPSQQKINFAFSNFLNIIENNEKMSAWWKIDGGSFFRSIFAAIINKSVSTDKEETRLLCVGVGGGGKVVRASLTASP